MRNIKKIIALLPLIIIPFVQASTSLEATIASGYRPHGAELDNSATVMGALTHKLSGRFDGLSMGFGLVSGSTLSGLSYLERGYIVDYSTSLVGQDIAVGYERRDLDLSSGTGKVQYDEFTIGTSVMGLGISTRCFCRRHK